MSKFFETIKKEDSSYQVTSAQCFSKESMYLFIETEWEDEEEDCTEGAAALVKVNLRDFSSEILLELSDVEVLNAHSLRQDLHYILASGGTMHCFENGVHTVIPYVSESYLTGLCTVSPTAMLVYGDDGEAYKLEGGTYTKVSCETENRIVGGSFLAPDRGFLVGVYGTFLQGGVSGFKPVPLPSSVFDVEGAPGSKHIVVCAFAKPDGSVLMGTDEGPAYRYYDGELTELSGLQDEETVMNINEFQGEEFFGGDDYGLYTRKGNELVPRFATEGGMILNVSEAGMTVTSGPVVYLFNGSEWLQLQVNPNEARLIEKVTLDFDPNNP